MAKKSKPGHSLSANSDLSTTKVTKDGGKKARQTVRKAVEKAVAKGLTRPRKQQMSQVGSTVAAASSRGAPARSKRHVIKESYDSPTVSYTEFLGSMWGSPTALTKVMELPLNPGYGLVFKQSQQEAAVYEKFTIIGLELRYTTRAPSANSGDWLAYIDYDAGDAAATTLAEITANRTVAEGSVWQSQRINMGKMLRRAGVHFVHMGAPETTVAEARQDNPGILRVYLERPNTPSSMGFFTLRWTIKWSSRRAVVPSVLVTSGSVSQERANVTVKSTGQSAGFFAPMDLAMTTSDGFTGTDLWPAPPVGHTWSGGPAVGTASYGQYVTDLAVTPPAPSVTASNLSVLNSVETTPLRSPAGCAVIHIPPGDWRLRVNANLFATKNGGADLPMRLVLALFDPNVPTTPSSITVLASATNSGGFVYFPGANLFSNLQINYTYSRYAIVYLDWSVAAASDFTLSSIKFAITLSRQTVGGLDESQGTTQSFSYPEQASMLESALADDFKGTVTLSAAPTPKEDVLEAAVDKRLRELGLLRSSAKEKTRLGLTPPIAIGDEEKLSEHSYDVP